ncbi:MAG: hypothetical protein QOJ07_2201 [Thermoleophilaceae bacterium]|jgi:hypothetical protein|nr:hypothetical protein [Thermoleophilaceae bacterium]
MSSRKEQKEKLRAEREKREAEAAAAERRRKLIGYGAAGALILAAVVAIVVVIASSGGKAGSDRAAAPADNAAFVKAAIPPKKATNLEAAAAKAGCSVKQFPQEGRNHTNGPYKYKTNPPTSGDHYEIPAQDGAYTQAPNIGQLVHELEHGRIIIWYRPDVSAKLKGQLKALFDEDSYHMVLTPNTTHMPYPVAASGWTRSITCPKMNDNVFDALRLFRDRYRDQGPEKIA